MDQDNTNGRMEVRTQVNLKMDRSMEKESGRNRLIHKLATAMKESINLIKRMVKEYSNGKVATFIEEATRMMKEMGMEKCFGQMALYTKENGKKESSMEKGG